MNVRFNPPQLKAARQVDLLLRVVGELTPADMNGEIRVVHTLQSEPMRIVLITSGRQPVSLSLPREWLYTEEVEEEEIRTRVTELLESVHTAPRV